MSTNILIMNLILIIYLFVKMVFYSPKYLISLSMTLEMLSFLILLGLIFLEANSSNQMIWMVSLLILIISGLISINMLVTYSKIKGLGFVKV